MLAVAASKCVWVLWVTLVSKLLKKKKKNPIITQTVNSRVNVDKNRRTTRVHTMNLFYIQRATKSASAEIFYRIRCLRVALYDSLLLTHFIHFNCYFYCVDMFTEKNAHNERTRAVDAIVRQFKSNAMDAFTICASWAVEQKRPSLRRFQTLTSMRRFHVGPRLIHVLPSEYPFLFLYISAD